MRSISATTREIATANDSSRSATISRRGFVKLGGALFVCVALPSHLNGAAQAPNSPDASRLASWLEIRADNSIIVRTGRAETGTGMSGYYAQTVAEELNVLPETISLIMGDTDKTPDGGYSAGFLSGMANLRKVAAYAREALLELAAKRFDLPVSGLSVSTGIVSGGGKSVAYGKLVEGQQLELKIPVTGILAKSAPGQWVGLLGLEGLVVDGAPPMKTPDKFQVMGKSYPMPGIPDKVTGKTEWTCDVSLPGMLHARMIRPATFGSTLVAVGTLDNTKFPTAEVIAKGDLVAVVSPDEWEAISAAQTVSTTTKWSEWSGLPGNEGVTKFLRAQKWGKPESGGDTSKFAMAMTTLVAKTISRSYEQGYVRHAPIGPFLAVADVREDGSVTVWTHSAQSQGLRARIAYLLSMSPEKVVIRWLDHSGQYGRTTLGGDGAEADAVILSKLTGRPVRVQWTLQEDLMWSTVSPAWVSDIKAGLDANGNIAAFHSSFYSPHMFDPRPLGALLAGMPCSTSQPGSFIATEWIYDKLEGRLEDAYGGANIGAETKSAGLRGNIMRTPGQRQQNFALEGFMNEMAAAANADPIEFRKRYTTDERMIAILDATAKVAGWEPRSSPHRNPRRTGATPVTGRGMCLMRRENAYWAGIAEISLIPSTGVIQVTKFTIGCEPGKVINPRQLDRCMKGGVVMGVSEALKEEVTFDSGKVTSTNWNRYKILTMGETPDIQVVQLSRDDKGFGGGAEAANGLVPPAVAAAFFDATGIHARRIPLTPKYVLTLLKSTAKGTMAAKSA